MRLLDLFCGAGGASMGYSMAGFDITGVDIKPQTRYPFEFVQADALEYLVAHGKEFDIIHASPPCQAYSRIRKLVEACYGKRDYPELIEPTRKMLIETKLPYVIENVPRAPIRPDIKLNGLMFGLRVLRERWFETNWFINCLQPPLPKKPRHKVTNSFNGISGFDHGADYISVCGNNFIVADARIAMGINWMTRNEIKEAIPPAYTKWIGDQIIQWMIRKGE